MTEQQTALVQAEPVQTARAQAATPIDNVAALDDLPVGAVIRSTSGNVWLVADPETDGTELRYIGAGGGDYYNGRSVLALHGFLTVIWDPRHEAG